MKKIGEIFYVWRKVFGNWKYLLLGIFVTLLFYELNVILSNYQNIFSFHSSLGLFGTVRFFANLSINFFEIVKIYSFISLIAISVLFGMLCSLLIYKIGAKTSRSAKKAGIFGGVGAFLGIFTPGCAACGIGIASFLGVGVGFLSALPLKGQELAYIAICALVFSIITVSKDLTTCEVCKIKFKNGKMKGGIKHERRNKK